MREKTHGLSQKIQGTYFKISALYFKIHGLYFLPFQVSDSQQLTKVFQNHLILWFLAFCAKPCKTPRNSQTVKAAPCPARTAAKGEYLATNGFLFNFAYHKLFIIYGNYTSKQDSATSAKGVERNF